MGISSRIDFQRYRTSRTFGAGPGTDERWPHVVAGKSVTNTGTELQRIFELISNRAPRDTSFAANGGPTDGSIPETLQADGKVYIYGSFYYYAGQFRGGILRLKFRTALSMARSFLPTRNTH